MTTEKFCTKCGKKFIATGREVICPACKQAAAEETKRAAVLKAKRASWTGESVPVRISGRASTLIRRYGTAHNLPFAQALDALLKSTDYFKSAGQAWEDITPYKSHRRDKATNTAETAQEVPQEVKQEEVKQASKASASKQDKPVKPVKQAAKKAVKTTAGKAGKKA